MPYRRSTKARGRQGSSWLQQPGFIGATGRFWQRSYAPDYLGFALLITAYILVQQKSTYAQTYALTHSSASLLCHTIPSHVLPGRPIEILPPRARRKSPSPLVIWVWRRSALDRHRCVGIDLTTWIPSSTCLNTRSFHQLGSDPLPHRYHQELCRTAET